MGKSKAGRLMHRLVPLLFCLIFLHPQTKAETFLIAEEEIILDGKGNLSHVSPGDSLILSGNRRFLIIKNFSGTDVNPIVITNAVNSPLIISSDNSFGISIQNCNHVTVTGRHVDANYGIQVFTPNGVAVGIGYLSQNWTLSGLEIGNTKGPGILAKTDPNCTLEATRDKFLQYGGKILHCYIHDTGTEGIYFGSSAYGGYNTNCNGVDTTLLPHLIVGGEIAYNRVVNSGWDAIQIASALRSSVHHNTIINDSQSRQSYHMNAIIAGLGFSGKIYNNLILNGEGNGIFSKARDSLYIENNVILNPGFSRAQGSGQYGIYVDMENPEANYLQINNNLISNPRYQAFHGRIGANITWAEFSNNIITYNDSLTGDVGELYSIPLGVLDAFNKNHINTSDQLALYYWESDSLDQRNNGFTTDQGQMLPYYNPIDFYDRPRIDESGVMDIGPFEYHTNTTQIKETLPTSLCSPQQLIKDIENTNAVSIYTLSGKKINNKSWNDLERGTYILLGKQSQCISIFVK